MFTSADQSGKVCFEAGIFRIQLKFGVENFCWTESLSPKLKNIIVS